MWDLLWEEDSRATIKLSTVKKRFGQKITRELLCLESGFSAVGICVERADGFFDVLVDICIVGIFRIQR
jgi:hypothetical protein